MSSFQSFAKSKHRFAAGTEVKAVLDAKVVIVPERAPAALTPNLSVAAMPAFIGIDAGVGRRSVATLFIAQSCSCMQASTDTIAVF